MSNKKLLILTSSLIFAGSIMTALIIHFNNRPAIISIASQDVAQGVVVDLVDCTSRDAFNYIRYCDAAGNEVQTEEYNADGSLKRLWRMEYDQDGNVIKQELYDAENDLLSYLLFEYDQDGNMIKRDYYDTEGNGDLDNYWLFEYDQDGNLVREEEYDRDGNLLTRRLSEYDRFGNQVVKEEISKCGDSTGHSGIGARDYCDEDGNIVRKELEKAGQFIGYWLYKYNQDGNTVRAAWYDTKDNLKYYWLYKYNQEGLRILGERYDADGNFQYREDYEEAERELLTTPPKL